MPKTVKIHRIPTTTSEIEPEQATRRRASPKHRPTSKAKPGVATGQSKRKGVTAKDAAIPTACEDVRAGTRPTAPQHRRAAKPTPPVAATKGGRRSKPSADAAPPTPTGARTGTRLALLIDLLRRQGGATVPEIAAALGWQAHSVRGAISGSIRKKLGLAVTSEKVGDRGRVYRIAGEA